jgi:hypothetical protein
MNTPDQTVQELRDGTPAAEPPRVAAAGPPPYPGETQAAWARRKAAYYGDDPRRKSPVLASLLSLMPGLGQVYLGYYQHGFINILVIGSTIALLTNHNEGMRPFVPLLALFLAFFWLFNVADAGRRATLYNHSLAGLDPMSLPDDVQMPSMKGSLFGGVALLLLGLIIASNTLFDVPLNWVEHWWPVALVIAGGYLIYQSMKKK